MRKILAITAAAMMAGSAVADLVLGPGDTLTENFDSIGTSQTATLPTDWKVSTNNTVRLVDSWASAISSTTQRAGNNMSSTAANGIYNYAAGVYSSATDRAVGFISSSSASKSGNLFTAIQNTGAVSIASLTVAYDVEKYRDGSNAAGFSIQLYYSADGSSWTSAGSNFLTSFSAGAGNTGYDPAPGATVAVSGTLTYDLAPSSTLYLAWNYSVTSTTTTSNAQGLGVDNISLTAIPEPGTMSLLGGFGLLLAIRRRMKVV